MGLNERLKRQFRRIYNADLLPVAMSSFKLGDIVEWDGVLRKKMDFECYSLIDNLKIDAGKKTELKTRLAVVKIENAVMQKVSIDSRFNIKGGVDIPNFATGISMELGFERFLDFNIDGVKCRILSDDLKVEIRNILIKAKEEDKKFYRRNLKQLFFIDKLFYAGSASFELKDTSKTEIEAALTASKIVNPKIDINSAGNIKVEFTGNNEIPFAADIEHLKDFID